MDSNEPKVCFEVSFECGNKVGGIHTILKTKAKEMKEKYGENYYTVGFFDKYKHADEFVQEDTPQELIPIFDELTKKGIDCHYGKWVLGNDVKLILIDSKDFEYKELDNIKKTLWDEYKVDSMRTKGDYNEPVAWSVAAGMLIEKMKDKVTSVKNANVVAHFHEWLSGPGLLYLKSKKIPIGLVFTTHATRIGRTKSELGENLMEEIFNGMSKNQLFDNNKANDYELEALHGVEFQTTQNADVFTTVSEVVKDEAGYILHRQADVIVPNALDFEEFVTTRTLTSMHQKYKNRINEFLEAYFLPYYPIETKDNTVIFISGRYEFMNKGVDLFLHALKKLNDKLRGSDSKGIFVFILVPADIKGPKDTVLKSIIQYQRMRDLIEDNFEDVTDNIINKTLSGEKIDFDQVFGKEFMIKLRTHSRFFSNLKNKTPPLTAFDLKNPENGDKIIQSLKETGLDNQRDDKVKVIFYPTYLSPNDGLLGMTYKDFVIGSSMGIFPSRYEPWGYTPFETAALRTVSVTTDVAGFGRFIMDNFSEKDSAIKVLNILGKSKEVVANDLANIIEEFVNLDIGEKMMRKLVCREQVESLDWKIQTKNYFKAHKIAIERMKVRLSL